MNKAKKKLPDKLSTLIRVAVEDAKKIEKDPRYILNMDIWHMPQTEYNDINGHYKETGKAPWSIYLRAANILEKVGL